MIITKFKRLALPYVLRIDILRYIYGLTYGKKLVGRKIKNINEIKSSFLIKNGEVCDLFSPQINGVELCKQKNSPDINIFSLENVVGSVNSNFFYDKKNAYFDKVESIHRDDANYVCGNLIFHDEKKAVFKVNARKIIEETCFFLGGSASFNYYHWLIEILPKILFLNEEVINKYKIKSIVLNKKVREIESFMASFEALAAKNNLRIIFCSEEDDLHFKKVIYLSFFNIVLFNSKTNKIKLDDSIFCKSSLDELRSSIISNNSFVAQEKSNVFFPKKIFLMRGKVSGFNKRDYNEKEILNFFKERGFEPVFPEKYSFYEQAYLFANAEEIVGPSGAFWSNLIFCTPGTLALSWLPNSFKEFSVYSTIAKFYKVNMFFTTYEVEGELHGGYNLEVNKIKDFFDLSKKQK